MNSGNEVGQAAPTELDSKKKKSPCKPMWYVADVGADVFIFSASYNWAVV